MNTTNKIYRAFPGGAVVKTLAFHCRGCPFHPWWGGVGVGKTHMPWGRKIKTQDRSNIVTKFHKSFNK